MILSVFKEFYNMQKNLFSSPLKKPHEYWENLMYFNPHSLIIHTRFDKLSFLGRKSFGKIHEKHQFRLEKH